MIFSFRSRETESIWRGDFVKGLPPDIQNLTRRKLRMLNSAKRLDDLRIERGGSKGLHSIAIDERWRLGFFWTGRGAKEVEVIV